VNEVAGGDETAKKFTAKIMSQSACQRRLPTGGAANGKPFKAVTAPARQTHKIANQFIFICD
jgi:hypothetical protein